MGLAKALWRFSGVVAAVLAWIVIGVSTYWNPWFNVFEHAFSDLGGPSAASPWIYNVGLVAVGAIVCIYSAYLAYAAGGKVYVYSSALLFVAGLFLALIGLFPTGTRHHDFVSMWFFVQVWLSLVATAVGMTRDGKTLRCLALWAMALAGPLGALLVEWPSVALLEAYGIALIDLYVAILTVSF